MPCTHTHDVLQPWHNHGPCTHAVHHYTARSGQPVYVTAEQRMRCFCAFDLLLCPLVMNTSYSSSNTSSTASSNCSSRSNNMEDVPSSIQLPCCCSMQAQLDAAFTALTIAQSILATLLKILTVLDACFPMLLLPLLSRRSLLQFDPWFPWPTADMRPFASQCNKT